MPEPTTVAAAPASATETSQTAPNATANGQPAPTTTLGTQPAPATDGQGTTQQPAAQKPVVPEKYDLKLPDGSMLDAAHLATIGSYAKELGLTQEQAQKFVERDAALVGSFREREASRWNDMVKTWGEQSKADPEIGGEKFTVNSQAAVKALDKFGTPALRKMLNDTGAGNHPELVRVFARIGQAMADDKIVTGSNGGKLPRDAALVLYGSKPAT
jgi:hypothetical protein